MPLRGLSEYHGPYARRTWHVANGSIRNVETLREVLRHACEVRELLILVTPYLRFESSFLRLDSDAIHVAANMSREDALFGLQAPTLRIRFPHGFSFVEGNTRLLGLGLVGTRKSLRLSIPTSLEEVDQRGSYRVERVGRVDVTFSTRKYELISGSLANMSTTGARIRSVRDFEEDEVQTGDSVNITIPLTGEIHINSRAMVRYVQSRTVGLEFRPPLGGQQLERLSRWVFQRREEDRDRLTPKAEPTTAGPMEAIEAGCLVLVSSSTELENQARTLLTELPTLRRVSPTLQTLKDVLVSQPTLLIFHVQSTRLDERRMLKAMVEFLAGRCPFLLLGTGDMDPAALFEMGGEMKAVGTYQLGPSPTVFFQRLIQGILRRLYHDAEGPMVPKEPEAPR